MKTTFTISYPSLQAILLELRRQLYHVAVGEVGVIPRSLLRGITPKPKNLRTAATGRLGDTLAYRSVLAPAS